MESKAPEAVARPGAMRYLGSAMPRRQIFIISDLHVGGASPTPDQPRGFRMLTRADALTSFVSGLVDQNQPTELVINGDFVDFLAEKDENGGWLPFVADPHKAVRRLDAIVERDAAFFNALREMLARGHRITLLLGNHDLELSLPLVRHRLQEHLGAVGSGRFSFIYDGEAYVIGDALIEHGNRYDGFNTVDHDALRRLRSIQSRGLWPDEKVTFEPPTGSRLVAAIMNRIKSTYPFIDLLKPETEAALPILLAIDPGLRRHIPRVLAFKDQAKRHDPVAPARPKYSGDIAARSTESDQDDAGEVRAPSQDDLEGVLTKVLGREDAREFLHALADEEGSDAVSGDIGSVGLSTGLTIARLAVSGGEALERRLPILLEGLRALQNDKSFDRSLETNAHILAAAKKLASVGFRWVIFGHTHLAKEVGLDGGATYFNTGTWADIIRFPKEMLTEPKHTLLPQLRAFVEDMASEGYKKWITFSPTYVRLDVENDAVTNAALLPYSSEAPGS
jgi:UDP-2,3-diacylglucosamine pyrophosphatase LpxH